MEKIQKSLPSAPGWEVTKDGELCQQPRAARSEAGGYGQKLVGNNLKRSQT